MRASGKETVGSTVTPEFIAEEDDSTPATTSFASKNSSERPRNTAKARWEGTRVIGSS